MTLRQQFEAFYIGKHFCISIERGDLTYRGCQKHMQDEWLGHKYNSADIENSWQQFQREIEQ